MEYPSDGLPYPKQFEIKDDIIMEVRPETPEDIEKLIIFFREIPEGDRLVLRRDVTNRQVMQDRIKELQSGYLISHLALIDDQIVGEATVYAQPYGWFRHVGDLRIIVDPKFRNMGIGNNLTQDMIGLVAHRNLDKIMIHLMEHQVSQINHLKEMGFVDEARLKNHITDHRGDKHTLVVMTHYVPDLWRRLEDMIMDTDAFYIR